MTEPTRCSLDALASLRERLHEEFERALAQSGELRGLYVSEQEVADVLHAVAPAPPLDPDRLESLCLTFGLDDRDRELLVACAVADLEPSLGRVFAYLQDDIAKTRPNVGLLLRLFPDVRARLHPASALARAMLIQLPDGADAPLLGQAPSVDERVIGHLSGLDALDGRLLAHTSWDAEPRPRMLTADATERVTVAASRCGGDLIALTGSGSAQAARQAARTRSRSLLVVEIPTLLRCPACSPPQAVRLVLREARLLDADVYWSDAAALWDESAPPGPLAVLEAELRTWPGLAMLGGPASWEPPPTLGGRVVIRVPMPAPSRADRERAWAGALAACGQADAPVPSGLAGAFRLSVEQISDAVRIAIRTATADGRDAPEPADLAAGARAVSGRRLVSLGREIAPRARWADLVLPADPMTQLREFCAAVRTHGTVLEEWGFGRRLSGGTGITALFAGISGTGKTMAAEVVAGELGLPLFRIDLAGVVSKWIGETEKNLDRVFEAAADSNALLVFDEADALFGKRSEVRDSHDRYANLEISYLLQKMEAYDGAAILATNMRQQIDDAFLRRLAFTVVFPLPEAGDRVRIWEAVWPPELPRSSDVDVERLARLKLTGGNIKNVVMAAAHLAADDGGVVSMTQLLHAVRREYQKLGKQLQPGELAAQLEE